MTADVVLFVCLVAALACALGLYALDEIEAQALGVRSVLVAASVAALVTLALVLWRAG